MQNENVKLCGSSIALWCGHTDDLILLMLRIYLLQRATTILDEVFTNYGLCIIVSKTKTMILNHMLIEDKYSDTIISLRNVPFQNSTSTTEFKYIDSFISRNKSNTKDIKINDRIQMAYAKFATMTNLIQNSKINLKTRVKGLNSFVRSKLTYSSQNWGGSIRKIRRSVLQSSKENDKRLIQAAY